MTSTTTKLSKLRGYEFFQAIGSPKRVIAPMVDQSELAFRMLCRHYGAELCYTPMFHSRLFSESREYRERNFQTNAQDRPLVVQFCGNDPKTLLAAAKLVENDCDAVDLNMGCPQGIARKGRYGAFLMKEKELVREIVHTLSSNLSIPVTCKIRVFPSLQETLEFCDMLQEAGCDLLVVHGRTKEMNKLLVRECDWQAIAAIKQRLKIPVIANGGIENVDDFEQCLKITGADGVMTSEGVLENPALFAPRGSPFYQLPYVQMAKEYLNYCQKYPTTSLKMIRAHLFKLLFQDLCVHVDLRTRLASGIDCQELEGIQQLVEELAQRYQQQPKTVDYCPEKSWYRRHRRANLKAAEAKDAKVAIKLGSMKNGKTEANDSTGSNSAVEPIEEQQRALKKARPSPESEAPDEQTDT